jgi:hypothetical protein
VLQVMNPEEVVMLAVNRIFHPTDFSEFSDAAVPRARWRATTLPV